MGKQNTDSCLSLSLSLPLCATESIFGNLSGALSKKLLELPQFHLPIESREFAEKKKETERERETEREIITSRDT